MARSHLAVKDEINAPTEKKSVRVKFFIHTQPDVDDNKSDLNMLTIILTAQDGQN